MTTAGSASHVSQMQQIPIEYIYGLHKLRIWQGFTYTLGIPFQTLEPQSWKQLGVC